MKEFDCGNCPLDPCKMTGDECGLFLDICERFQALTDSRESEEYLRDFDTSARDET